MVKVVSISNQSSSSFQHEEYAYGNSENRGRQKSHEDALAWGILSQKELTPEGEETMLNPKEIGHRLWTTYHILNSEDLDETGTTASTTVYDGEDNLITATLGDTVAFLAIYDTSGVPLGVSRLNSEILSPKVAKEKERIEKAGGKVSKRGRIQDELGLSRAIGNKSYKQFGLTADATIDCNSITSIITQLNIEHSNIGKIQVIVACDGFTEPCRSTKSNHEKYLMSILKKKLTAPGAMSEKQLADELVQYAISKKSNDNISVAIQTIGTLPFYIGAYDGNNGVKAAHHVATNIESTFKTQCSLTKEQYEAQSLSVKNNRLSYNLAHMTLPNNTPEVKKPQTKPIEIIVPDRNQEKRNLLEVSKFNEKLDNLKKKIVVFNETYESDIEACNDVNELEIALCNAQFAFLASEEPLETSIETFKNTCKDAIREAQDTISEHRGWKQFWLSVAQVLAVIVTLGCVPKAWDPKYFTTPTDTQRHVDEVSEALNHVRLELK